MNVIWKELSTQAEKQSLNLNEIDFFHLNAVVPLTNYSIIKISGPEAAKFLQGQLSNDVLQLSSGNWQMTCCCNQKGRILAVIFLVLYNEDYFAIIEHSTTQRVFVELKKFAVFSKVTLAIVENLFLLGSIGPTNPILTKIAMLQLPFGNNTQQTVLIIQEENLATIPDQLPLAPMSLWQYSNIQRGIPEICEKTQEQFTPHQLNLPALNAVSFTKGCYRGQEIIARMHYLGKLKQGLYRIILKTSMNYFPGDTLIDTTNTAIGEIVNLLLLTENIYTGLACMNNLTAEQMIELNDSSQLEVYFSSNSAR